MMRLENPALYREYTKADLADKARMSHYAEVVKQREKTRMAVESQRALLTEEPGGEYKAVLEGSKSELRDKLQGLEVRRKEMIERLQLYEASAPKVRDAMRPRMREDSRAISREVFKMLPDLYTEVKNVTDIGDLAEKVKAKDIDSLPRYRPRDMKAIDTYRKRLQGYQVTIDQMKPEEREETFGEGKAGITNMENTMTAIQGVIDNLDKMAEGARNVLNPLLTMDTIVNKFINDVEGLDVQEANIKSLEGIINKARDGAEGIYSAGQAFIKIATALKEVEDARIAAIRTEISYREAKPDKSGEPGNRMGSAFLDQMYGVNKASPLWGTVNQPALL
jgi:hypothetical protein